MTHLPAPETRPDLGAGLTRLFAAPTPNPASVARLERAAHPRRGSTTGTAFVACYQPLRRWAMGALALVLAVAVAGPSRVVAQIQQWLDYVPGIGFVDLDGTRVLTAPVEVVQDGVTMRVTQALAEPDQTTVLFEMEGLPPPDLGGSTPGGQYRAELRLPDGTRVSSHLALAGSGVMRGRRELRGRIFLSPLPGGVYQVTLVLSDLPYTGPGIASAEWEVPLTLRPAKGELVSELFPQPYALAACRRERAEGVLG